MKQDWPKRTEFVVGEKNIKYEQLAKPEKVLLPPLHIKPGLMKQFVKALAKKGDCFKYLCVKLPTITEKKSKLVYSMGLRSSLPQCNAISRTGCMECICSGGDQFSWQYES